MGWLLAILPWWCTTTNPVTCKRVRTIIHIDMLLLTMGTHPTVWVFQHQIFPFFPSLASSARYLVPGAWCLVRGSRNQEYHSLPTGLSPFPSVPSHPAPSRPQPVVAPSYQRPTSPQHALISPSSRPFNHHIQSSTTPPGGPLV